MDTFRALVVDDEDEIRELALEVAQERKILVDVAKSLKDAEDLLTQRFYNVAYVDLDLEGGPRENTDGFTLLHEIRDARRSCRRVLLTEQSERYPAEVFAMLDPDCRLIHGARDKRDITHLFVEYLTAEVDSWLQAPVRVEGIEAVLERLLKRNLPKVQLLDGRAIDVTHEELDFVVSKLMGQTVAPEKEDPDRIDSIALELLDGGKSRSVVTAAQPTSRSGSKGIRCVVKIGSREDTEEERSRYERYVKYRMSLHRRVELLGSTLGDSIGAVCYSFAGRSANSITDLQTLLDSEDKRAFRCMRSLLGQAEDWHPDGDRQLDLAGFFGRAYGVDVRNLTREVSSFAEREAERFEAHKVGPTLRLKGGKLNLPTNSDFTAGKMRGHFSTSVVHGDMNASNVVISDDDHVILIDFRHTTRGPWALDFAALQASVRLSDPCCENMPAGAPAALQLEQRLWKHDWSSSEPWWPKEAGREPPYWASAAACLMQLANDSLEGATAHEHAATSLLYALRVFRVASLSRESKLRLLVWMSVLRDILKRPAAAQLGP